MILLIKLITGLAFIMFVIDFIRAKDKNQFLCGLIGHKWFTNEGCTFCLRCMESNATTLSQQRKKLLEAKTEARKQERKAKNVK